MKIQQFFEHHGVGTNPFAEEDAQTDPVFKAHCIASTYHPTWDKIYGDPADPATSIVFGEKGAGKTALRLQIVRHVAQYNRAHPDARLFVIEYDDFNPFLDHFRDQLGRFRQRSDKVLSHWKLWDHMDAILSLGVTQTVDALLAPVGSSAPSATAESADPPPLGTLNPTRLDRHQARDLLLLAACYDRSTAEPARQRWHRLRRKLRFSTWSAQRWWFLGWLGTLLVFGLIFGLQKWDWLASPWPYVFVVAGWIPWLLALAKWSWRARSIARQLRVIPREVNPLRQVFMHFTADELSGQPLPNKERTDDRFELLAKFQGALASLGVRGILVIVDRLDEPHLVNGSPEQMRNLIWPLLDNKFLKHPGVGFKLLLPIELSYFIDREERDFYQRARLDKQNLIPSLEWTGEALYDVANARLRACALAGKQPSLRSMFDEGVSDARLIDALRGLRVPRRLFKFLYRLFVNHANTHTDEQPVWRVSSGTFESTLAVVMRDQDAFDRGMGAG